jgi:beta-N-acetylhexosaminidase
VRPALRFVVPCGLLVLALGAAPPAPAAAPEGRAPAPWAIHGVDVDHLLDRLTVEEKVGQLLLLGFGGTVMDDTIAAFLDDMKPGGVALFGRNIDTPEQTMRLIRDVRGHDPAARLGGVPMFVAVDQEGGNVVRLKKSATILPSAMALGAANDPELARRAGAALGRDLKLLGFNMNLAPVLDVNSNPRNPVIGIRSFGESPSAVAELGVAYIEGMQSEGVLAVAKHFPGHGDTDADSHYHLPVLQHDKQRLEDVELLPFARAFAEGLDAIMTAHIALPALGLETGEEKDLPATVSPRVLTRLLREELGYDGLVMTDGLEMQGIVQRFGSGEAAVRAVLAGADVVMVLWFPEKKREVKDALLAAARSGRLPAWRLDQAVRRVLVAKARRGLFDKSQRSMREALSALDKADRSVVQEIAGRAITVVKDEGVLPLSRGQRVVVASTEPLFAALLRDKLGARLLPLGLAPTKARVQEASARLVEMARDADVVVVADQNLDHRPLVERLRRSLPHVRVVFMSFGSPYLATHLPPVDAYVCAFGWRDESERAAAAALTGGASPTGQLPVSLPLKSVAGAKRGGSGSPPGAAHGSAPGAAARLAETR